MTRILLAALFLAPVVVGCSEPDATSLPAIPDVPAEAVRGQVFTSLEDWAAATPDPRRRYLFYLHGAIIERGDRRPTHPEYGVYEYDAILERFVGAGLIVISEQRGPDTVPRDYARRVAGAVERLIEAGVPQSHITVVGFSKGAGIALWVSDLVPFAGVGHVIMGACSAPYTSAPFRLHGRVLSIYEASDEIGRSCRSLVGAFAGEPQFREVEIAIGGRHGTFYSPRPEWVDEVLSWAGSARLRP